MLPCMCCLFFWGCHKHNSLTLGPIQPSSPSTPELLAQSGHPECSKAIKISDRLHKCISHLNQITFERMNFAKDATIFKLYLNFKIDLFQGPIIQLVAGISQSTKRLGAPWQVDLSEPTIQGSWVQIPCTPSNLLLSNLVLYLSLC